MDSTSIQIEILIILSWLPILIPACTGRRKRKKASIKNRLDAGGVKTLVPSPARTALQTARPALVSAQAKPSAAKPVSSSGSKTPDCGPTRTSLGTALENTPECSRDKWTSKEKVVVNPCRSKEYVENKFLPYPEVKEPTASQKKRRAQELAEDKKAKIATGFYQQNSDEDDTLEQVKSLTKEESEKTRLKNLNLKSLFGKKPGGSKEKGIKM